jgi:hypothetical protein
MSSYEVVAPPPVRPLIEALAGKRAGYRGVYEKLERDPCSDDLGAYRLSGPLEPIVCGVHLKRGYRLAFTMQPPEKKGGRERVVILYVGKREPHHGETDIWNVLHDLFGVSNPPGSHLKPKCCETDLPEIGDEALDEFLKTARAFTRRTRSRMRARRGKGAR